MAVAHKRSASKRHLKFRASLIPSGKMAAEPYALLQTALEKKDRTDVGQVPFSAREQFVVVRPFTGVPTMAKLKNDAEFQTTEVKAEFTRPRAESSKWKFPGALLWVHALADTRATATGRPLFEVRCT